MCASDDTPLHSRAQEIDYAVRRCADGSGAIVWTGDPGMGKSGVLAAAARRAAAAGHHVLPVPTGRGTGAGSTALDALVGQLDTYLPSGRVRGADALAAAVTEVSAATGNRTVVFVADDLDLVDPDTRTALVALIVERHAPAVLLASATEPRTVHRLPYEVERRPLDPINAIDALQVLRAAVGTPVAPHVAERLVQELGGAPGAIIETAELLSPDQLAGLSLIPDPLPATASVLSAIAPRVATLDTDARALLLTAAVSVVDGTDILLHACDITIDVLVSSPAAAHLTLVAGHVRITDPRVRAVIHHRATVAQRTEAHTRLAVAHAADHASHHGADHGADHGAGHPVPLASWHAALAALAGKPAVAPDLLAVAERMLAHGDAVWAQRVAQEAVAHATGSIRAEAVALAGRAALRAGHVVDAVELLRDAVHHASPTLRATLRPALLLAVSLRTGQVPRVTEPEAATSAQLLAAVLHSERGESDAARALIDVAAPQVTTEDDRDRLAFVEACLALLRGDPAGATALEGTPSDSPARAAMVSGLRALALASQDQIDEARRGLTAALSDLAPLTNSCAWALGTCDAAPPTARRYLSPLAEAYLRLTEVIVELWAGSLEAARAALQNAALHTPVMLCLGGTAAVLAGRLDSLQRGEPGVLTRALERLVPVQPSRAVRVGFLSNRALCMLVTGEHQSAATFFGLVEDESDAGTIPLPGPSSAEATLLGGGRCPAVPEGDRAAGLPPDPSGCSVVAASVAARVCVAARAHDASNQLDRCIAEALALSRRLHSPLERGQTRLVVGQALVLRGELEDGVAHLRAASGLFEECGAHAMAVVSHALLTDAVTARRREPEPATRTRERTAAEPAPTAPCPPVGLAAIASRLTEREREVVEAVVTGASNRMVARRLQVSVRTVEVHLTSIFRKLGVGSRVELALLVMLREPAPPKG